MLLEMHSCTDLGYCLLGTICQWFALTLWGVLQSRLLIMSVGLPLLTRCYVGSRSSSVGPRQNTTPLMVRAGALRNRTKPTTRHQTSPIGFSFLQACSTPIWCATEGDPGGSPSEAKALATPRSAHPNRILPLAFWASQPSKKRKRCNSGKLKKNANITVLCRTLFAVDGGHSPNFSTLHRSRVMPFMPLAAWASQPCKSGKEATVANSARM